MDVVHFSDPGCPFAWSASPALATLRWRFGDQLDWRHVTIGLTEEAEEYERRGFTALKMARSYARFRRYGMPFSTQPKQRVAATGLACRAVVAVRLAAPEREWAALRALQFMQFCTTGLLDDPRAVHRALAGVPGIDAGAVMAATGSDGVEAAYQADRAEAREAQDTPSEAQGKTAAVDGPVRYTAPTLVFDGRLEAGGFQPYAVYDNLVANLDPELLRRPEPETVDEVLAEFPDGLTTAEVAAVMAGGTQDADPVDAESALLELVAGGEARRLAVGEGALWLPAHAPVLELAA